MPRAACTGLRTVAVGARQPEIHDVELRAARMHRRRRLVPASAAVAAVVLALNTAGCKAPATGAPGTPGATSSGDVRRVVYPAAGDATHLYAVTQPCDQPSPCPVDLYGSDDAGRTWQPRTLPPAEKASNTGMAGNLIALGPRTLVVSGYLSADGGATWREMTESGEPADAVPARHRALACGQPFRAESCSVLVVDPGTAQVAPLDNQPPILAVDLLDAPPEAGVWVSGFDPESDRRAVAWSRDAGRTWTRHVFTEANPVPAHAPPAMAPQMATADGRTAYAIVRTNDGDAVKIYRTGDGGTTWRQFHQSERLPSFLTSVTGDGAHLLMVHNYGGGQFVASRDGGPYRPVQTAGLAGRPVFAPKAMTGGGYLTYVGDRDRAIYLSDDGRSWRRIPVE